MKFTCPKCTTRHSIPDAELPPGVTLRFVCPQCSNIIGVRRRDTAPVQPAEAPPSSSAPTTEAAAAPASLPVENLLSPVGDQVFAELSSTFNNPMRAPTHPATPKWNSPFDAEPEDGTAAAPVASAPSDPLEPAYLDTPPGQATRVFMRTAGVYRARRNARLALVGGTSLLILVTLLVTADVRGWISIPFMGVVYDMTGLADPNLHRAIARTEEQLAHSNLSAQERVSLREKLMGISADEPAPLPATKRHPKATALVSSTPAVAATDLAAPALTPTPAPIPAPAPMVMGKADGNGKQERRAGMSDDADLPASLTPAAINKVVHDSKGSLASCYAEASRHGKVQSGKMEVQLIIGTTGDVLAASILTARFRRGPMGQCTLQRVRNWKFPKFHGDAVTAVFPYVLSAGL